ncbi:MAG: OsmC family peroxiredoxin [Sphingomonadales bacterium]|nr:OsmC family peroxiredoxin [Sphingomonadales bacterium]NCP00204.1 OsmC family peroxiredoxin [Sphingomonadales bacterium]NCP49921.1 OsmC family peroxiredoxin [Sphingomonadales bacterium]NCQ10012.1 OsmC family peroxiredoxin [Sphingomonadales bacterium]NCQ49798.1 OsmC family peroxiredoxin [Sphingomonadales bacterium]
MSAANHLGTSPLPRFFAVDGWGEPLPAPAAGWGHTVRVTVRSLSMMQKEAIVSSSANGRSWRLVSDEGDYLNGFDEAPPPLAFLSTGMVASYMDELLALAAKRGIDVQGIRLTLDNYYTMQGSALRGTMVGGADHPELTVECPALAGNRDEAMSLLLDTTGASPMHGLVSTARSGTFALILNGERISSGEVGGQDNAVEPDSDARFDRLRPAPGAWDVLLERGGPTPRTGEADSGPGSSLAETQDRRLHVRAVCTLHEDGLKDIQQSMFNPQGTMFRFLSDPEGQRAPDASAYVATGIGFCFMTQLGRYAKIVRRDLQRYAVVQDMDFSQGGATGDTGRAGNASAPRTTVSIRSSEDADFVRQLLKIGEQTCFLHALCRTALKTRIRLA